MLTYENYDAPKRCRRCERVIGLAHGGLYWTGEDRDPVCRNCFDTERQEAGYPTEIYPRCMTCRMEITGSCREGPAGLVCHHCFDASPQGLKEIWAMRQRWQETHRLKHGPHRQIKAATTTPRVVDFADYLLRLPAPSRSPD